MTDVLSKAGRAALRAVIPVLFVVGLGILGAKDLSGIKLQVTTGIIAIVAAAVGAIQAFVPQLSFAGYLNVAYAKYLDAFVQTFLGTLFSLGLSLLTAPSVSWDKAAWTGVLVGALTAAVRAVQGLFTTGEGPAPQTGFRVPAAAVPERR